MTGESIPIIGKEVKLKAGQITIKLINPSQKENKMVPKGKLIKDYGDGTFVLRPGRWNQIESKVMPLHNLISKEMLGWVKTNIYWVLIWDERYYKVPFAKNKLWFMALTSELEFLTIRELPQIYLA